jgi:hypothetical protein
MFTSMLSRHAICEVGAAVAGAWLVRPHGREPQGPLGADWSSSDRKQGNNGRSDLEANVTRNLSPHRPFRNAIDYKPLFLRTVRRLTLDSAVLLSSNGNSWTAKRNVSPSEIYTYRPTPASSVSKGIVYDRLPKD